MSRMLSVALREYLYNLRRPAFLFAVFGVPLFTLVMWGVIFLVVDKTENNIADVGHVGYVDQAGILASYPLPADDAALFVAYPTDAAARQALDEKTVSAYFVLPDNYLTSGTVETYTYNSSLSASLRDRIRTLLRSAIASELPEGTPVERITNPVNLVVHAEDSGRELTESSSAALILMPMLFALVFIMAVGVTSGFLMNGIVEEKTNRVMEILVTSVTPTQLLTGKIIGLGLLGLTQMVIWGVAGGVAIALGQSLPFLSGVTFPTDLALLALVYFVLSYFLIASLMAGVGVVANSEQESRQFSSIISLMWVLPFFFVAQFIDDPNGVVPILLTLIPITSPISALMRVGLSAVPAWQIIASLVILFVTMIVTAWGSARVFRWGMLRYGKRVSLRDMIRAVRRPAQFTTTASKGGMSS